MNECSVRSSQSNDYEIPGVVVVVDSVVTCDKNITFTIRKTYIPICGKTYGTYDLTNVTVNLPVCCLLKMTHSSPMDPRLMTVVASLMMCVGLVFVKSGLLAEAKLTGMIQLVLTAE